MHETEGTVSTTWLVESSLVKRGDRWIPFLESEPEEFEAPLRYTGATVDCCRDYEELVDTPALIALVKEIEDEVARLERTPETDPEFLDKRKKQLTTLKNIIIEVF